MKIKELFVYIWNHQKKGERIRLLLERPIGRKYHRIIITREFNRGNRWKEFSKCSLSASIGSITNLIAILTYFKEIMENDRDGD